jgi:hypothetical protein
MKRASDIIFSIVVISIVPAAPASAYVDPASISMALQVVTGAVASVLIFGKVHLLRITTFFRKPADLAAAPADEEPKA